MRGGALGRGRRWLESVSFHGTESRSSEDVRRKRLSSQGRDRGDPSGRAVRACGTGPAGRCTDRRGRRPRIGIRSLAARQTAQAGVQPRGGGALGGAGRLDLHAAGRPAGSGAARSAVAAGRRDRGLLPGQHRHRDGGPQPGPGFGILPYLAGLVRLDRRLLLHRPDAGRLPTAGAGSVRAAGTGARLAVDLAAGRVQSRPPRAAAGKAAASQRRRGAER